MSGDSDNIDDSVIEALRPQERRYDVAIDKDMVLSVLPNGVKTWTWVYDDPDNPHRKTLGIYPDMTLEDARKSLGAEKAAYRQADEAEPSFVIRDGRIEPARGGITRSQLPIIAGAVGAVVVAALAWLLFGRGGDPAPAAAGVADTPAAPARTAPEQAAATTDAAKPAMGSQPEQAMPAGPDNGSATGGNPSAVPGSADPIVAEMEAQVAAINERLNAELERIKAISDGNASNTQPAVTEIPAADNASPDIQPAAAETNRPAPARQPAVIPPPEPVPAAPVTAAPVTAAAVLPAAGEPAAQPVTDPRVARAILTTTVIDREPADDLGNTLIGSSVSEQVFYFFTELRDLGGQRVYHRWIHNGSVMAEVPFTVGEGAWRWRVYSSKTFIPELEGDWRVDVVLGDGTLLHSQPFLYSIGY